MRARGITYDTGFTPSGQSSRSSFDPESARRELRIIADELHCDAVRITGDDPERLTVAAQHAVDAGLEVWFSPFPCELSADQLLPYFADCAVRADAVGAEVFVAGCELTLFGTGFLPGAHTLARIAAFTSDEPSALAGLADANARLNAALAATAATVRKRFHGKLTYAAGTWEDIDWTPFDIVGIDAYGDPAHPAYRQGLEALRTLGKPIAVTEVGCCTYRGAAELSGSGWDIIDHDAEPPRVTGDYRRDEDEPVRYMRALFDLFEAESVDTAFWHTFASYHLRHHPDPRFDTDLASFGVCKVMPDGSLAPKRAFHALADLCGAARPSLRGQRGRA
ncbi:hypothetical protein [Nocardia goodfellowii]|uniref:Abortive infection protein n=1 Tax=Nocardia goodfellowii TaxID=882446 RepID=A0ABS4QLF9_9NOCA|nr:hypothetical protein [Nocardia goodfellowii]MBP2192539.1 hypothetical protein [Nocardia goodfellowii]